MFDLEMQVEVGDNTIRFPCRVGFFVGNGPRNILGMNVLFQHFQIAFNDIAQEIYLRPENENLPVGVSALRSREERRGISA